jgi:hypothetical protein
MIAALFTFLFFYFDGSFVSFAKVEEKENQSTSGSRAKSLARARKSEKSSWSNSKLDGLHRHHHLKRSPRSYYINSPSPLFFSSFEPRAPFDYLLLFALKLSSSKSESYAFDNERQNDDDAAAY